jgi:hypothetical protein
MGVKALHQGRHVAGLAGWAMAMLSPAAASAQTPGPAPASGSAPVTLVVDLAPSAPLEAERLRGAVARELGAPVIWGRDGKGGTLVVRQEGDHVVVSFDRPDGHHDGRAIPLASDPAQAERDIALLAGNVARDQAAQFIAPPAPPQAVAPPVPPAVVARPASPAPWPSPCDATGPHLPVAIDFAPWVGVSTKDQGRSIRNLSIGIAGELSGGLTGLAVSGGVNVDDGPLCGVQVSGAVNVAGDSRGAQVTGAVNIAQRVTGVQIAGGVNVAGDDSSGAQLGTVNVMGGHLRGVQIGVVNYAPDIDFQLGLVNINGSGRLLLDAWTKPEMGLVLAGVKHGGTHYHWIYGFGTRPADPARPWAALGLGAHVTPAEKLYVDIDVVDHLQLVFGSGDATQIYEARAVVGYRVLPQLALFAGPTFNLLAEATSARTGAPDYATDLADTSRTSYRSWPGITLGVEAL